MTTVLEVSELHKTFHVGMRRRAVPVLRGVSFSVRSGEIFGFLGPNGAGKTTTIKAVCDLIRPDKGHVKVLGGSFSDSAIRARVGIMPEQAYYHEYLTAREFLSFHGTLAGLGGGGLARKLGELLALVNLEHAADRPLRKFSKGMLQRIGLAQALVADPELLILDEPMSGLDPIGRREVRDILLACKAQGRSIFFSTHILPDVELICDRVVILHRGRTVTEAGTAELTSVATGLYDIELADFPLEHHSAMAEIGKSAPTSGPFMRYVVAEQDLQAALALVHSSGARIHRVEAQRRTLEESFLEALEHDGREEVRT